MEDVLQEHIYQDQHVNLMSHARMVKHGIQKDFCVFARIRLNGMERDVYLVLEEKFGKSEKVVSVLQVRSFQVLDANKLMKVDVEIFLIQFGKTDYVSARMASI